jgi:methylenetetrahydrofolate reductase (NADPH)
MPLLSKGRRWQSPYKPFKRVKLGERMLILLERMVKGPLWGCRMCGNCMLQETSYICPMQCSKGARNGPCGGSTPEACYVDDSRPCIWHDIYERAFKAGREDKLLEVLPPLDWEKVGGETWGDVARQIRKVGFGKFLGGRFTRDANKRKETWEAVFEPIRQPDWWKGDAEYHPPTYEEPASELERRLKEGEWVVTSEVAPPMGAVTGKLEREINMIKSYVAAINFTDSPSATPRMSSQACSLKCLQNDAEPVMQIAARDRTRVGVQAEVIGASALGIRNMLCLSGDSAAIGPAPRSRMEVLDIDAIQMLWILRRIRDEGAYLDGRKIKKPPMYFLGAAAAPFASKPEYQALREQKKVNAGAQYFQTNLVYDPEGMQPWLEALDKRGVLEKVYLLIGVTPLKNYKMARYLNDDVPGVSIPEPLLARMEKAGDGAQEEGVQIALEIIEKIKAMPGVNGIHLMPVMWEAIVPRIIVESDLLPKGFVAPEKHEEWIAKAT